MMMPGYPKGYQVATDGNHINERPEIFDPALSHYPHGFRLGAPTQLDAAASQQWFDARSAVMELLLQLIAASHWRDSLVLRGSLLLKAWLGDQSRPPGDLDWVFRPATVGSHSDLANRLFDDLIAMVLAAPQSGSAKISPDKIAVDDIWTYERAAGRRITYVWSAENLPSGEMQIDVVFNEDLLTDPIPVTIPSADGQGINVWGASKELSLAWKLQWLQNDSYPQGKDLYDATLLAEQTYLPITLLRRVLPEMGDRLHPKFPLDWQVDWKEFISEYPSIQGNEEDWKQRLTTAIAPTFNKLEVN